jgi:hypothetical protein
MMEDDEGHCFVHAHVYYPNLYIDGGQEKRGDGKKTETDAGHCDD